MSPIARLLHFPSVEGLLLLGPLVAVPIGLRLAAPSGPLRGRWRVAAYVQPAAAALLVASFCLPAGPAAAALASPWLAFAALMALLGVLRFAERGPSPAEELAIDAALIFPVVGATWLLASRAGLPFMGFVEPTVLLTAAHFHFAGFALPLLTGLAGRAVPGRHSTGACVGVVVGVPLVALGITLSAKGISGVELLAASWLAGAGALSALLQVRAATRQPRSWALLAAPAFCLLGGMLFAAAWGLRPLTASMWPSFETMIAVHATLNVLGYTLPSLAAWRFARPATASRRAGFDLLLPWLGDRPDLAHWEARSVPASVERGPSEGDAHDDSAAVLARGADFRRVADAVLRYDVFPPTHLDRVVRREPVDVGDTVGASYRLLPGVRLFFASRVVARFDDGVRAGFTYRTLDGHPECGEETFSAERDPSTGEVRVALRAWSRPGTFATRLLPRLARRMQLGASRAALRHLATRA